MAGLLMCDYCAQPMNVHKRKDKDGHITYICPTCKRMATEKV